MLKTAVEELLYWGISIFVNLILFTLLATVFIIKVKETPEFYPLKVELKKIEIKKPKRERSVRKSQSVAKKTVAKRTKAPSVKNKAGAGVASPLEKGDVPVPVEEEVSVLEELQKKISAKLERQKREEVKKEVGQLSAVVTGEEVRIKGGTRNILYTPPPPELVTREFPSRVRIRIWVDPDGTVIRAVLLQRSGSANIDNTLLTYVRGIKFEEVETSEVQVGEITFSFQGG
jgi:protein TonB